MTRMGYFVDGLSFSYTQRAYLPTGWVAVCRGTSHDTRTRAGARLWLVLHCWRGARDDVRLDRLLARRSRET
jgi:hypothetical protein